MLVIFIIQFKKKKKRNAKKKSDWNINEETKKIIHAIDKKKNLKKKTNLLSPSYITTYVDGLTRDVGQMMLVVSPRVTTAVSEKKRFTSWRHRKEEPIYENDVRPRDLNSDRVLKGRNRADPRLTTGSRAPVQRLLPPVAWHAVDSEGKKQQNIY